MNERYIHSTRIYSKYGLRNGYILEQNGIIKDILRQAPGKDAEVIDYGDSRIIPGIIDVHNHGYGGWSMTDPVTPETFCGYVKACASIGITTILPTVTKEAPGIEGIVEGMKHPYTGSHVLGIHSEGPFWARGGEHTVGESWPEPSVDLTKKYIDRCQGNLKVMAIAPELPHAHDVMHYLHQQGIRVAACHTKANAQQIKDAMTDAGIDIVTHLCNGMQGIHHRDAGALGAFMLEDNLSYELIADLNHVCADMIRLLFRLLPYEKFVLISDSNYIAGLPSGVYERYGNKNFSTEKGLIVDENGRIRGSGKCVLSNMEKLVEVVGVPFEQVIRMASANPATYLGISHLTGSIAPGHQLDIAVISDDYKCLATYVKGRIVYDAEKDKEVFNPDALKRRVGDLPEDMQ